MTNLNGTPAALKGGAELDGHDGQQKVVHMDAIALSSEDVAVVARTGNCKTAKELRGG